jgi:hypothetical protein
MERSTRLRLCGVPTPALLVGGGLLGYVSYRTRQG